MAVAGLRIPLLSCCSYSATSRPAHNRPHAVAAPAPAHPRRSRGWAVVSRANRGGSEGGGLEDLDVAVFRFTLGIPGFDDALIPRVVGAVGAVALLLNHFLSGSEPSDAQVRAEVLGTLLAAVGLVTPTLEQRIKELQPGRGRLAASEAVEGASRVFALQGGLPDSVKQDAAWASFALLRNSNICGLVALWEGQTVLARGLVGLPPGTASGDGEAVLAALTQAFQSSPPPAAGYWQDKASIRSGGPAALPCVPSGAQSVLVQPLQPLSGSSAGGNPQQGEGWGWLILLSERPRALSASERAWAAAVAGKLWTALGQAR